MGSISEIVFGAVLAVAFVLAFWLLADFISNMHAQARHRSSR